MRKRPHACPALSACGLPPPADSILLWSPAWARRRQGQSGRGGPAFHFRSSHLLVVTFLDASEFSRLHLEVGGMKNIHLPTSEGS